MWGADSETESTADMEAESGLNLKTIFGPTDFVVDFDPLNSKYNPHRYRQSRPNCQARQARQARQIN